jgi:hypothetical protein
MGKINELFIGHLNYVCRRQPIDRESTWEIGLTLLIGAFSDICSVGKFGFRNSF